MAMGDLACHHQKSGACHSYGSIDLFFSPMQCELKQPTRPNRFMMIYDIHGAKSDPDSCKLYKLKGVATWTSYPQSTKSKQGCKCLSGTAHNFVGLPFVSLQKRSLSSVSA